MKRRGYNPLGVSTINLYGSAAFILDGIKNSIGFPRKSIANRWDDVSGNNRHLYFNEFRTFGANFLAPGVLDFNRMDVINAPILSGTEFTFEIIASISSFSNNNWLLQNRATNASANGFQCAWFSNNLLFGVLNNGSAKSVLFPYTSLNTIFHIQVTVKQGELKLYVNNVLRATNTSITASDISAMISSNLYNVASAKNWTVNADLKGSLYAVRMFNRLLTPTELNNNYLLDKLRFGF